MHVTNSRFKNDLSLDIKVKAFQKGLPDGEKYVSKLSLLPNEFFIMYVTEGIVAFRHNENAFKLKKNNFIIAREGDSLEFMFSRKNPCTYFKIDFFDNAPTPLFDRYGLTSGRNFCYDPSFIISLFSNLLSQYIKANDSLPPALIENLFYYLSNSSEKKSVTEKNIYNLAEEICQNYREEIDVRKYSESAGITYERFSQIFNKTIGEGPHRYQLIKKIEEAQYLIIYTDLPINEVSKLLNFNSPLYFSNLFKKYTGVSPTEYRKLHKE